MYKGSVSTFSLLLSCRFNYHLCGVRLCSRPSKHLSETTCFSGRNTPGALESLRSKPLTRSWTLKRAPSDASLRYNYSNSKRMRRYFWVDLDKVELCWSKAKAEEPQASSR